MQDRYAGDIGDFGKYGLLRAITQPDITKKGGPETLNPGVVWYRHPDEKDTNDGKYIDYLALSRRENFRKCDPELYDCLAQIVRYDSRTKKAKDRRSISKLEDSKILGSQTRFFDEECPYDADARKKWRRKALNAMKGCDVVFLDPDNGLRCEDRTPVSFQSPDSGKHAYLEEVLGFTRQGSAVIFYHHPDRTGGQSPTHNEQIRKLAQYIARKLDSNHRVSAFRYRRGNSRAFFIIWPLARQEVFKPRMKAIHDGLWGKECRLKPKCFELTAPSISGKSRGNPS